MNSANIAPIHRKTSDPQGKVDEEIRHIRDLVFVRSLLAGGRWSRSCERTTR